jgi:uncharacterized membrane protein YkoI
MAMQVKSALLSALFAVGALGAPLGVTTPAQLAQPSLLIQTQGRGGQDIRSLREVVDEIRSQYGGELISARLEEGGRPIYVLRWRMPDGQVRDFRVSAAR